MNKLILFSKNRLLIFLLVSLISSCLSSRYDTLSYQQSTGIKVEALTLMDKANTPYASHQPEVEALLLKARKALEYEKHRPKNTESTRMWEIMLTPNKNLLAGFLEKWKNGGPQNPALIDEAKKQVEEGFDAIIKLESKKIKGN